MVKLGAIAILVAKLVFLVAGYALIIGLTRLLGPADFGLYSLVNGVVALVNMVLISGTMQTVSHFVAADNGKTPGLRRRFLAYQAIFAFLAVGGLSFLSYVLPGFFKEPSLRPLLRLALFVPAAYAFYAVNIGYLNGRRFFVKQASLDILFSVLKVSAMLALASLGFGVMGVFGGFALAALAILLVSFLMIRGEGEAPKEEPPTATIPFAQFAQYAISVMGVALLLNAVFQTDLFLLKSITGTADESATLAGLYAAAQQIARIPYYGMVTVGLVLFPSIAALSSKHTTDPQAQQANRARLAHVGSSVLGGSLNLMLGMTAIAVPLASDLVHVIYPTSYDASAPALAVLIAGVAALTILYLATTVISSAGFPRISLWFLGITLAIQAASAFVFVPKWSMVGAALATLIASAAVALFALLWLRAHLGVRISAFYLLRSMLAAAIPGALAYAFHTAEFGATSRVATLIFLGFEAGLFIVLSLVLGILPGPSTGKRSLLLVSKALSEPFNDGAKVYVLRLAEQLQSRIPIAILVEKSAPDSISAAKAIPIYGRSLLNRSGFARSRAFQNLRVFGYLLLYRYHFSGLHFFFAPNPITSTAVWILRLMSPGLVFVQSVLSRPRAFSSRAPLYFGHAITASSKTTARSIEALVATPVSVLSPIAPETPPVTSQRELPEHQEARASTLLFAGDIDKGGALPNLAAMLPTIFSQDARVRLSFSIRRKHADTEANARRFLEAHLGSYLHRIDIFVDHAPFDALLDAQDAMLFPAEDMEDKVDIPLVALETLARGKPVFILQRPPITELYDADPALLTRYAADTPEALATRVLDFLARTPHQKDASEASEASDDAAAIQEIVRRSFGGDAAADRVVALYAARGLMTANDLAPTP